MARVAAVARFRWLLLPPMVMAVLLDLFQAIGGPVVLVGTCVGIALGVGVDRGLRERTPNPRWQLAGIALALVAAIVTALAGQWSAALAWGLIVTAGAHAARGRDALGLLVPTVILGVISPIGLVGGIAAFLALATLTAMSVSISVGVLARTQRDRIAEVKHVVAVEERARIAADLHDLVAHEVTGMVVLAQAAGAASSDPVAAQALERITASGQRALSEIRALVARDPATSPRTPNAGGSSLAELARTFAQSSQAQVTVDLGSTPIPDSVDIALHRVLTELLTNVRRHSTPRTVSITLTQEPSGWTLRVSNDGIGGGVGGGNRSGLDRVHERVAALCGSVRAGLDPSGRWVTEVVIPTELP